MTFLQGVTDAQAVCGGRRAASRGVPPGRGARPRRVLAPVLLLAWLGCADPGSTGRECVPQCAPTFQQCRDGACVDVCSGPCPAGYHCNFDVGGCVSDRDAGPDDFGPPCDSDRDGDFLPDSMEGEGDPDGDTVPNADDEDADGDTIYDLEEAGDEVCGTYALDTDADTIPDYLDLDSDEDGVADAVEAGDDRPETHPRDTDDWGAPDCRDTDSDNDGLNDAQERVFGSDRVVVDSDDDGWTDFEEWGAGTDPLDSASVVPAEVRVERVPYDSTSVRRQFVFTIDFKSIDVALLLGCSSGTAPALADLAAGFGTEVKGRLLAGFPRLQLGVVLLGDGPRLLAKTGSPVARLLAGTAEPALWSAALERLPECGDGACAPLVPEAIAELADGRPLPGAVPPPPCPAGTFGLTCLRPGTLPLALLVTDDVRAAGGDEPSGARSQTAARAAFVEGLGGRVVPVHVGADDSAADAFRSFAQQFGAIGPEGVPLVVRAGEGGAAGAAAVAEAVDMAARRIQYDVELAAVDLPDDPPAVDPAREVDASQFVIYVDAYRHAPAPGFSAVESVAYQSGATFYGALRGVEVSYRVYYRNGTLQAVLDGRRYRARLVGRTLEGVEIASWEIVFLVAARVGDVADGR
ncbi:MAG: hypothetical protein HY907_16850 [Deltaproteobacteria bacterium]|nr:hypothetical protein [Deltaproteobacteria bacterium]